MKILLITALLFVGQNITAWSGEMVKGTFANVAGSRGYQLYVPAEKTANMPLFVVLHGCFMTGDQMSVGTNLNTLADQNHFYVLYPEQAYGDNSWKCWNWFKPENLARETGEASIIAGMARKLIKENGMDKNRVFVTGLSAGAAMASNMVACYSDVFTGLMVHSGLEYAAASSESEAHDVMKNGSKKNLNETALQAYKCSPQRASLIPVMVVHGTSDPYVGLVNAEHVITQFGNLNKLIKPNARITESQSRIDQDNHKLSAVVGDTSFDGVPALRIIKVEGMGHGWSGGLPKAPYMEPRGVDASSLMVEFFLKKK